MDHKEILHSGYTQEVAELINGGEYFGRMNDPTSCACLTGPCGDSMEFYLVIEKERITEITYYADGCQATMICAAMATKLADGKSLQEALEISVAQVITRLKRLPLEHLHCSILAVSTLYRAIANYLLKK